MTTFDAIYRDGALHPTVPLQLVEGAAIRLTMLEPPVTPPPNPILSNDGEYAHSRNGVSAPTPSTAPDAADVLARILASAAKAHIIGDNPDVTSQNVDAVLYGGLGGAR